MCIQTCNLQIINAVLISHINSRHFVEIVPPNRPPPPSHPHTPPYSYHRRCPGLLPATSASQKRRQEPFFVCAPNKEGPLVWTLTHTPIHTIHKRLYKRRAYKKCAGSKHKINWGKYTEPPCQQIHIFYRGLYTTQNVFVQFTPIEWPRSIWS